MKMVIAIVGMPGAGKSAAGDFFKQKGMYVLRFGSVIDDGLKEEELPWSAENNQYYREKIRRELGMAGVVIGKLLKIDEILFKENGIFLDGLNWWEEKSFLKVE